MNTFDVTSLVVGSIVGADIYVAAAIGVALIGPASLLVWVAAGIIAILIAQSFSLSVSMMPRVGGPYAYVKEVAGPFSGFVVGWALLLAEWFSLAVFPVAFAQYFVALFRISDPVLDILVKGIFVLVVFLTNLFGVRLAGRFNDSLTIAKLAPLFLLIIAGSVFMLANPGVAGSNFTPFVHGDLLSFGQAIVLIFWAYAGFELATLPANEIENPGRTISRAIAVGMLIVITFYLLTNFVIIGVVDDGTLSASQSPLLDAANNIFSGFGDLSIIILFFIGVGALVSIMGADESSTIGTSRLAYAMSIDGLMPRSMGTLHKRYNTPYISLIFLSVTAFVASILGGLTQLISASVFLLAFVYFATCISVIFLEKKIKQKVHARTLVVSTLGIIFSGLLMVLVDPILILISLVLVGVGIPVYVVYAPKTVHHESRERYLARDAVLSRAYEQGENFLGFLVRRIKLYYYRLKDIENAWVLHREIDDAKLKLDEKKPSP